jgi:hypothetical protein
MGEDGFAAKFGPTTVERKDPLFKISPTCCWWSGNSWPYATSQTLKAMANLIQGANQDVVSKADYLKLLATFAKTHRKDGKPYIAEACDPDTGSWQGHDSYNHSEHYLHSNFCDLVITGLVGVNPENAPNFVLRPLAPAEWDYFALDNLPYRGHTLTVFWDRTGRRYGKGAGLHLLVDGKEVASSKELGRLYAKITPTPEPPRKYPVNFAVNNDGAYYPRVTASFTAKGTSTAKVIDGNYWYHRDPPNRWTCEDSPNASDSVAIDLGVKRLLHTVKLYFLDDGMGVVPPARFDLEHWDGRNWQPVPKQTRTPEKPTGRRANSITFPVVETAKLRVVLHHAEGGKSGLTEFEAWGDAKLPVESPPYPPGNLAYNAGAKEFPKAGASHTSRFDKIAMANDGKVSFAPTPHNRWTSYESPNATDWLEVDFGAEKAFRRVELAIYDDRGGVQPPAKYEVEYWDGRAWKAVTGAKKSPEKPTGGQWNEVRFDRVKAGKVRVVFNHAGKARSGVSEILVWDE